MDTAAHKHSVPLWPQKNLSLPTFEAACHCLRSVQLSCAINKSSLTIRKAKTCNKKGPTYDSLAMHWLKLKEASEIGRGR